MASLNPKTGILGKRLAAHLLRRATFKISKDRITAFSQKTVTQAVDELLVIQPNTLDRPYDFVLGGPWINVVPEPLSEDKSSEGLLRQFVTAWWLDEARQDDSVGHKMQYFLHSIWIIHTDSGRSEHFYDYLKLLENYQLGSFRDLSVKMTLNNLMLRYLDNVFNNKNNPNENYARELLELFTMGEGNYNNDDIAAAAEVLTGFTWVYNRSNIDPDTNLPMGTANFGNHAVNNKTFSQQYFPDANGNPTVITGAIDAADMYRELDDFIDMIFAQQETGKYIVRKMYRMFVSKKITPEIESDIIEPLAADLRANNYTIGPVLEKLLKSEHFYDADDSDSADEIIGGLIRSPLELALHSFNYLELDIPDPVTDTENHYNIFYWRGVIYDMFLRAGFTIFRTSTPAGYPAYYQEPDYARSWFNSSTILARYKSPEMLIKGRRYNSTNNLLGAQLDLLNYVDSNVSNPYAVYTLVTELIDNMFPEIADQDRLNYFMDDIFLAGTMTAGDWAMVWGEYKTSGLNVEEINLALGNLIEAIMYSPEYQLF